MLRRMHTVSRQEMSLLSSLPVLYAYMNMHTLPTHSHTYMDTDAQAHTQLYIHQNIFIPTHTNMCPHPSIYPHTCIHALIFSHTNTHTHTHIHIHTHIHTNTHTNTHTCTNAQAPQALTHTCARVLKNTRVYKTKNVFTDITHNARTHTDTLIR